MTAIEEQIIKEQIEDQLVRAYEQYAIDHRAQGLQPRAFDDWICDEWLTDEIV